ncbi:MULTISPECIES: stage III sporulation protein SpoIIIAB [Paenibacillus]|uniref:stage III sporulation protein SpoIIIAB n=1 Tax=Paenibacillus TaxID=44249 RepID=UPI000403C1CE|nr:MULTISPECIES: stage III sporulation protein SpoIIIAB [Paenibacillus]KKC46171.1 stage III sporulation protein AB [Paenibacillus sp. D9]
MIKAAGAVLILLAGTMIGFLQAARFAKRPRQLRELIHGLQRLETEIGYGYTPLPEAMRRTGAHMAEPAASIFRLTSDRLESPDAPAFEACWEETLAGCWPGTAMRKTELATLRRLGSTLGMSDREDQLKHLRLAQQQMQAEEDGARDDQARYEKLSRSLGILIAALVVILMV